MYQSHSRLSLPVHMIPGHTPIDGVPSTNPAHHTGHGHGHSHGHSHGHGHPSRERVSISNLINAVDNTRITSSTQPLSRESGRSRKTERSRAQSAHGSARNGVGQGELDEIAARRRKMQSEKKRLWRKNLSPDQKAKRQELDAQRKREQRMNMTPDQRAEARRKDAARKAAKRKMQKEQLRESQGGSGGRSGGREASAWSSSRSLSALGIDAPGYKKNAIEDLLN